MNQDRIRLIVGAAIAIVLLGLYAYALVEAICLAYEGGNPKQLPDGTSFLLHMLGGLVSAVVAARLAVTERGKVPESERTGSDDRLATIVSLLYLGAWLALGVAAVSVGIVEQWNKVTALTDFAKAWIGLAIAAAYAYFGIQPPAAQRRHVA